MAFIAKGCASRCFKSLTYNPRSSVNQALQLEAYNFSLQQISSKLSLMHARGVDITKCLPQEVIKGFPFDVQHIRNARSYMPSAYVIKCVAELIISSYSSGEFQRLDRKTNYQLNQLFVYNKFNGCFR